MKIYNPQTDDSKARDKKINSCEHEWEYNIDNYVAVCSKCNCKIDVDCEGRHHVLLPDEELIYDDSKAEI